MTKLRGVGVAMVLGAMCAVAVVACKASEKDDDDLDGGSGSSSSGGSTSDGGTSEGGEDPTDGGTDGTTPAGDSGDDGGAPVSNATLAFTGEGAKAIPVDSAYKPLNIDGVPPFSNASLRILVGNTGAADVTVATIQITGLNGTMAGEWRVSKPGATGGDPFSLDGAVIKASEQAEFGLFFFPYASGPRAARVTVKLTDGTQSSFIVDGRGRDNLELSSNISIGYERVWGSSASGQVATGGVVSDGADGVVYNANLRQVLDTTGRDPALVHMKGDGTLAWAKVWNELLIQESPAPDQDNETGGSSDAIQNGGDGHVYVVASRSVTNANSIPGSFQALVYKANIATGALAWARGFRNSTFASPNDGDNVTWRGARGFAVDATMADRVLAVGVTGSPNRILLLALNKSDGSLIYSRRIDINNDGLGEFGFTVRSDAGGNGYIGGSENGRAVLVRLTGLNGTSPAIDWARDVSGRLDTLINSIVMAPNGDAICSFYAGGAQREIVATRISTTGTKVWAKTWESGNSGPNNTARVVRLRGNTVYVGGDIAVQAADTSRGDGFVMGLDADTGAWKFGSMYYTGKTVSTIAQNMVKGFAFNGNDVFTLQDMTPGAQNTNHYWGFWYTSPNDTLLLPVGNGSERLVDYTFVAPAAVGSSKIDYLQKDNGDTGGAHEGTAHVIDTAAIWVNAPDTVKLNDAKTYESDSKNVTFIQKQTITE